MWRAAVLAVSAGIVLALTGAPANADPAGPPTLANDQYDTEATQNLSILDSSAGLLANDRGSGLQMIVMGVPDVGSILSWNADGTFVYEPSPYFVGTASFGYTVRDANGYFRQARARIDVWTATVVAYPDRVHGYCPEYPSVRYEGRFGEPGGRSWWVQPCYIDPNVLRANDRWPGRPTGAPGLILEWEAPPTGWSRSTEWLLDGRLKITYEIPRICGWFTCPSAQFPARDNFRYRLDAGGGWASVDHWFHTP